MPSSNTRYFCTLFDSGYLIKGLSMLRSVHRHCDNVRIFVLCMDGEAQRILEKLQLPYVTCIPLADVETDELLKVKPDRGVAEYCWTLSPCLPWYLLQTYPQIDFITYLDADLLFYSSLQPLFEEIADASIAIIEHRFSPRLQDRIVNGRFCVEWVSFRRDDQGMSCLSRWREQCIEWCYYRLEEGRMGDQKYLDPWPELYSGCHIIMHPGAGIAPWNYSQYQFACDSEGNIMVDGTPLLFYHFHQFQLLDDGSFDRLSTFYTAERPEPGQVYERYEADLKLRIAEVRAVAPGFRGGFKRIGKVRGRRWVQRFAPRWLKDLARKVIRY